MGHILVLAAGANEQRTNLLVGHLVRLDFDILDIRADQMASWEDRRDASALVLCLGHETPGGDLGGDTDPYSGEAIDGRLIGAELEAIPGNVGTSRILSYNLTRWQGGDEPEIGSLVGHLQALVDHGVHEQYGVYLRDDYVINGASTSVAELRSLTDKIGSLAEILVDDSQHTQQLRQALLEVGRTYEVVKSAIECFVNAGVAEPQLNRKTFVELERGLLLKTIANGRGHCGRISTLYKKVGGLRSALSDRLSPDLLSEMDTTFEQLGTADGDLFYAMDHLGQGLTGESRSIVNKLLSGREDLAREQVLAAREKLLPLEAELDQALGSFQEVEASLGHAETTPVRGGGIKVTVQNVTINGTVVGSNFVAAETIENSWLLASGASISPELRSTLDQLHKAVANLTQSLDDDEAAAAAKNLKDLTEQATSPKPNRAILRQVSDSLISAAKTVTAVGLPVIDLVTKVLALAA